MSQKDLRIGFIGIGVLGKGLALALSASGYSVAAAHSRSPASSQWLADRISGCLTHDNPQQLADHSDLVFITTPDSIISQVSDSIDWRPGQAIVHCSGSQSPLILAKSQAQGALIGGFHPFQTFAGLDRPEEAVSRLAGITFAVAGEGWLKPFLSDLAADLGGRAVSIPESSRALYHASAVLGCGYLAALLQVAVDSWREMGFSDGEALAALLPLVETTVANIGKQGVAASVTGPVVRGDVGTIESHLAALSNSPPSALRVYQALTAASLPLAVQRGVDAGQLEQIRELIDDDHRRYCGCPE